MPLLTVDATGHIKVFAPGSTTAGYLPCDGSQYPETTYPSLYAVIGSTFNLGTETAGYFRLPNMQGKVKLGSGHDTGRGLSSRTLGQFLGEENHTLSTAEMPSHTHSGNTDPVADGHYHTGNSVSDALNLNHTHSYTANNYHGAGSPGGQGGGGNPVGSSTSGANNYTLVHSHSVTITSVSNTHVNNSYTTSTGTGISSSPHNNIQPSLAIPYYIKY